MNDTDVQAPNTDCKHKLHKNFKSDWLITMLFQGQQRCGSRNMSHLVKSGSVCSRSSFQFKARLDCTSCVWSPHLLFQGVRWSCVVSSERSSRLIRSSASRPILSVRSSSLGSMMAKSCLMEKTLGFRSLAKVAVFSSLACPLSSARIRLDSSRCAAESW